MSPIFREDPAEKIKCRKNMLGGRAQVECEEEKEIEEIYFGDDMKEKIRTHYGELVKIIMVY